MYSSKSKNRLDIAAVFVRQAQIIPAFLARFDAAEPIANEQEQEASQGRKTHVERTQGKKCPAAPDANEMPHYKSWDAQTKVQDQSPKASAAHQMIQRAVKQRNEKAK